MKGSIQKKGKIYYAVFAVGARRVWKKGGKTKADAQRVLNENLYELDNGTYKSVPKQTFGKFAEMWLEAHKAVKLKDSTAVYYGGVIERLASLNDRQMADITTGDLQVRITERLKLVSPNTARNDVTVIKLLFADARKWGYVKVDPAKDLDRPKRKKASIELLSPDQVGIFLTAVIVGFTASHFSRPFAPACARVNCGAFSGETLTGDRSRFTFVGQYGLGRFRPRSLTTQ